MSGLTGFLRCTKCGLVFEVPVETVGFIAIFHQAVEDMTGVDVATESFCTACSAPPAEEKAVE